MKRVFLALFALMLAGFANAALTLQFAKRWNAQEPLHGRFRGAVASTGGTVIAIGTAYPHLVLCKYDSAGNLMARRYYDSPGGGDERFEDAIPDLAGGVIVVYTVASSSVTRMVRLNKNLAPLVDVAIFSSPTEYSAMATDGTRAFFAAEKGPDTIFLDTDFASANTFVQTIDSGPADLIARMAVRNGEVILAGGTGLVPVVHWRSATTGQEIRSQTSSFPNWDQEESYCYDDLCVDADDGDILAVGSGRGPNGRRGIIFSSEFDGTGSSVVELPSTSFLPQKLAKPTPNSTDAYVYESSGSNIRVSRVATDSGVYLSSSDPVESNSSPLIVASQGQIHVARSTIGNEIAQTFTTSFNSSNTVFAADITRSHSLDQIVPGPVADTAYGVGSSVKDNFLRAKVVLMAATKVWELEESFFTFPIRSFQDSAEDAAGARYLVTHSSEVENEIFRGTILKVNASGAAVWARTLPWTNAYGTGTLPAATAMATDGSVLVAGTGGGVYGGVTTGFVSKLAAASGAPVWTQTLSHYGAPLSPRKIFAIADGSIYVSGFSDFSGNANDVFVAKLSSTGALLWLRNIDSAPGVSDLWCGAEPTSNGVAVAHRNLNGVARVQVFASSTGAILWDRILADPAQAPAQDMRMRSGPGGTLTVAVVYSDGAARNVIGAFRLSPSTKATLLNTRFGADTSSMELATLSTGDPIILDGVNRRVTRLHPTNGTVTWHRSLPSAVRLASDVEVDRMNNIYALTSETSPFLIKNALLTKFTPAGAVLEHRRSAGNGDQVSIGLSDSVWVFGNVFTPDRGREVSYIRYTQTLP